MTYMPVYSQTRDGKMIDLLAPCPSDVDFREMAETLSLLNRFAGNTLKPVSVALHTLIVCDALPEDLQSYGLLHDGHEAYIGEITSPCARALSRVALQHPHGDAVTDAIRVLKCRHDIAIYGAARLMPPSEAIAQRVHQADLVALATERRDFMAPSQKPWAREHENITPLPRVYRLRAPPDVADELFARFQRHLPVFAATKGAKTS